jgi:hypothetical protein
VSKLLVAFDRVLVAPSVASLCQVAGLLEVVDDLGCGAFGDSDAVGDVSEACVWIFAWWGSV